MENIELYKKQINSEVKEASVTDEGLQLFYDTSELKIDTYHQSDCCENVYADFSVMKFFIEQLKGAKLSNLVIKGVPDMGFLLCFEKVYDTPIKVFIPCYNSQNGYYSSNLSLVIKDNMVEHRIDIEKFVEDRIN